MNRFIEHAKQHPCGELSLIPDGRTMKALPDLFANNAEDVLGNTGDVRLYVTYCHETGLFSAGSRRHPGISFTIDGEVK